MLILSRVCADFHDRQGRMVFSVRPDTRLIFVEAPESIQEDPLFAMLLAEGSLEAPQSAVRRRQLENDPVGKTDAAGAGLPETGIAAEPEASPEAETLPPEEEAAAGKTKAAGKTSGKRGTAEPTA